MDVIIADSSITHLNEKFKFDAIITDRNDSNNFSCFFFRRIFLAFTIPAPYGIREKTKRIGAKVADDTNMIIENKTVNKTVTSEALLPQNHVPQKRKYCLSDIFEDLLDFASITLAENGRLVFWIPVFIESHTRCST